MRIVLFILIIFLLSCDKEEVVETYDVSGKGIRGTKVSYLENFTIIGGDGKWSIEGLEGEVTLYPELKGYEFEPYVVTGDESNIEFKGTRVIDQKTFAAIDFINSLVLDANGLVKSNAASTSLSLYDNALAAFVFIEQGEYALAERIFDFFNSRIDNELKVGPGGFSQFRSLSGVPYNHRWMGDNSWLLMALNHYRKETGNTEYDRLRTELEAWLRGLQDEDGGLFAGYADDDSLLNYKVTEGMIDAFCAVSGYDEFHKALLRYMKNDRWDPRIQSLMAWPENPPYRYALDNFSWAYCAFEDYPINTLYHADRFITTQSATINGASITGYDIDEDRDAVFMEGCGQMALAFKLANDEPAAEEIINEMEKLLTEANTGSGIPYSSNLGTGYGSDPLWQGADSELALSSTAWYYFARMGFNPFNASKRKSIPEQDRFW